MIHPLFQTPLRRATLLALPREPVEITLSIAVHRNHAFELVASVLDVFLALSRARARIIYSDYDDSLSFTNLADDVDMHLIWIDAARYTHANFSAWLIERITALQTRVGKRCKVLAACCGTPGLGQQRLQDTIFFDCDAFLASLEKEAFAPRLEAFAGTRLSDQANLRLARELGTHLIPQMLFPALKALVVDLDNTLYHGILGEDGAHNLTPHRELQEHLGKLACQGFLLALSSKNEEKDVHDLFTVRSDFPLRWQDFTAHAIGWEPKAQGLQSIAKALGIGLDAMLFIDDNPGERLHISRMLPQVRILPADDPAAMLAALQHFPGLQKQTLSTEDTLRSNDLKANQHRKVLRETLSPEEYLIKLGIELDIAVNPTESMERIHELLHKTNQFILSIKRPTHQQLKIYYIDNKQCVVTANMRDALSDSGLIAVGLFCNAADILVLEELAISCRALGRGIEDGMIRAMLHHAGKHLGTGHSIQINYVTGPRNRPALMWLQDLAETILQSQYGTIHIPLPSQTLRNVSVYAS